MSPTFFSWFVRWKSLMNGIRIKGSSFLRDLEKHFAKYQRSFSQAKSSIWRKRSVQRHVQDEPPNISESQGCIDKSLWWLSGSLQLVMSIISFLEANDNITMKIYCKHLAEMHVHLQHIKHALVNERGPLQFATKMHCKHVARMMLQKFGDLGHDTFTHPLIFLFFLPLITIFKHSNT